MQQERYSRIREIFTAALDRQPAERAAYIEEACEGDAELQAEVLSLFSELETSQGISLDESPGQHLRDAVSAVSGDPDPDDSQPEQLPESVEDYRVVRCLGEGGMGVVYEAEQRHPRRRVAVKVLRPGFATPSLVTRFRLEAELLGRLQHPGIARVYEASEGRPWGGSGPEQPFLVMEYVDGAPLTAWATRHGIGLPERLELLAKVCDAVHHAHERGVVHRDLKPANVLVDRQGHPRILDFGVARALDSDLAMATAHTGTSQLVGTLPYMSPEQLSGHADEVGPLSDVYALGVLAYEVLSGRLPLQLAGLAIGDAVERVQEVDPPTLGRLDERLAGDVSAIVSKALEKEPHRRYASAAEMAADLRRHLAKEPITARPQSAVYRATKFVRRNPKFIASVAFLVLVLAIGTAVTSVLAIRANEARKDAEQARDSALRASYRAELGAAFATLREGHVEAAATHLQRAPEPLRDWAWDVARSRLDDAVVRERLELGEEAAFVVTSRGDILVHGERGLRTFLFEPGRLRQQQSIEGDVVAVSPDGRRALERRGDEWIVHRLAEGPPVPGPSPRGACLSDGSWIVAPGGSPPLHVAEDGSSSAPLRSGLVMLDRHAPVGPEANWILLRDGSGRELVDPVDGRTLARFGGEFRAACAGREATEVLVGLEDRVLSLDLTRPDVDPRVLLSDLHLEPARLRMSPAGDLLLIVDASLTATTWDLETRERVATLGLVDYGIRTPWWAPDGSRILVADRTGVVRSHDPRTGRQLRPSLIGHVEAVEQLTWTADGAHVITLDRRGELRVFAAPHLGDSRRLRGHESYVYALDFLPDGRELVSAAWDGSLRRWDAWSGRELDRIATPARDSLALRAHPDGERVLLVQPEAAVLLSLRNGRVESTRESRRSGDAALSADGDFAVLAHASAASVSEIPDLSRERVSVSCTETGARPVTALAPDEGSFFLGCDVELRRFDSRDGRLLWSLEHVGDSLRRLAVSPDGATVVGAGKRGLISAFDVETGELLWQARSPGAPVYALAFHPSGAPLLTGSQDGVVRAWRLGESEALAELRCHDDYVHDLAFSPDGDLLASASADGTICIWDRQRRALRAASLFP